MSSPVTVMPHYLAESAGKAFAEIVAPFVDRIELAGSIRRRCQTCNDVEIVAIPKIETGCKAGELIPSEVDRLDEFLDTVARGKVPDLVKPEPAAGENQPAWGPRYKRLLIRHQGRWIKVDLFLTTRERWGSTFAIRTGSKEFSKLLVTPRLHNGGMPFRYRQAEGALQRCTGRVDGEETWEILPTPEESDYFAFLELPVLSPEERTVHRLQAVLQARHGAEPSTSPRMESSDARSYSQGR